MYDQRSVKVIKLNVENLLACAQKPGIPFRFKRN